VAKVTSKKPNSPSDKRPCYEPFYIPKNCKTCGAKLVYADSMANPEIPEDEFWYDEFMCPNCKDGIYLDWPRRTVVEINGCVETQLSHDEWLNDFIKWLESRHEYFGGGTKDVTDEEDE
jgi:hypothetical protein